jgi:hypothetical protein
VTTPLIRTRERTVDRTTRLSPSRRLGLTAAVLFLAAGPAAADTTSTLDLTGTNYFQNFDSIGGGLPTGWNVLTGATSTFVGNAATFVSSPTNWSDSTGSFRNSASTNGLNRFSTNFAQGNSTDRDLSVRQSSTFGDPGAAFALHVTNTTNLTSFQLSFDFEVLEANSKHTTWTVDYGVGANPTTFSALSGTITSNNFGKSTLSYTFDSGIENQNQDVWIRIAALSPANGGPNYDTIGINNVNLSWVVVPEPTGVLLACTAVAGVGVVRRRRPAD